ncbi:uncharacterized protein RJT20DRAFT_123456 [Scheffersomyces xylosifermentans]|uniref:uncharacterized protein n=1 Tax=Scheffersomyces xylosifermentans TaxID=1304137 RepID=UPI00315C9DE3
MITAEEDYTTNSIESKQLQSNYQRQSNLPPTESSLRKLLSSHSSIYNALTNPDLDVSPNFSRNESPRILTPDLADVNSFSITSWQSISGDSIFQDLRRLSPSPNVSGRPTSSILSVTTDEDDMGKDSTIIIASPKPSNVMVFETDEEDNEDETHGHFKPDSFIMPRMSVSENIPGTHNSAKSARNTTIPNTQYNSNQPLRVTILSSCNTYRYDTDYLIRSIESILDYSTITINHVALDSSNDYAGTSHSQFDKSLVKTSDLIFIVNDGSSVFLEYLKSVFGEKGAKDSEDKEQIESQSREESLPKLTIINIMTVNYFVNLFDLIDYLKPFQIWKTSSIKHEKLVSRFKNFIEVELGHLDQSEVCSQISKKGKDNVLTVSSKSAYSYASRSRTMYSNLISHKKVDYKLIEKQFKSDLQVSTTFSDPLSLSSGFGQVDILYQIARKLFVSSQLTPEGLRLTTKCASASSKPSRFWIVCSFTVGIGLGIAIASGATSLIGFYLYDGFLKVSNVKAEELVSLPAPVAKPIVDKFVDLSSDFQGCVTEMYNDVIASELFKEISSYSEFYTGYLKYVSGAVFDCIVGGFEKVVSIVSK